MKYYEVSNVLFYKRLGEDVWFTYRENGTKNKFHKWTKKTNRGAKLWIKTMKPPLPIGIKPISLAKIKKLGINP